jgi:MFS family permease
MNGIKNNNKAGVDLEAGNSSRGEFPPRRFKTFESFKYPAYCIYYGASIGQWTSMTMQMMVLFLLVYRITGSAAMIGIMAIGQAIPQLAISFFGGVIADRTEKKYVLIVGQIASALVSVAIALSLSFGYLTAANPDSWWILILSSVFQGAIMGFIMPAQMAIIPEIVGKERVMNAMSLALMGQTILRLMGPATAGFLIEAYDIATIYYLMTGIYLISTVIALFLPRARTKITSSGNTMNDVVEGLRYIRREAYIILIVVFTLCHVISGQPYMQLMPVFTEDILKVGASGLGILTSVSSIGALVGSFVLASLPDRKRGMLLIMSGIIMGLAVIVFSWSKSWPLSLAIIPFAGLGPTLHMAMTSTLIQYYVKPDYRGRMQSFVSMGAGLANFGTFFAGLLSESIGIEWAVGGMAIFLTIVSLGFLAFARPLTRLE